MPRKNKSSFVADVLTLVSGTVVAQLLTILAYPVLTRLYTPEHFGLLTIFTSITTILGVISCLRYEMSIMLPESDKEAANLLGVSLLFTVLTTLLTIPILWWGQDLLLEWLNVPELAPYLWLVTPFMFATGIFIALNYWNSRTKHFGRLSIARMSETTITSLSQLGLGFAGFVSGSTLIASSVGGKIVATAVLSYQTWRDDGKFFLHNINWRNMLQGIKRHRKFPLYGVWSALLNTISWQLPVFMLSAFFSSSIVGYYALGFRILQIPMGLIGRSLSQVFFQRAAEAKIQGTLPHLVEEMFRLLVIIGMFPILMLTIVGQDLYVIVFGAEWAEAGVYTQILAVWAFVWFISGPFSTLFSVMEKQDVQMKWNIVNFITRLISLYIGGFYGSPRLALYLFSFSGVFVYGYKILINLSISGASIPKALKLVAYYFLSFIPAAVTLLLLDFAGINAIIRLFIACCILAGYYIFIFRKNQHLLQWVKK